MFKPKIPECFLWNDEFCRDYDKIFEYLSDEYGEDLNNIPDDWKEEVEECELEPFFEFNEDIILESINEERFSEDGDEWEKFSKKLRESGYIEKINEMIPKLWYPNGKKYFITKQDLIDYAS